MPFDATPHPNRAKIAAAVERWISDAAGHPNGARLLAQKAQWVGDQIAILGRADLATPEHLEGLTVWDLQAAQFALEDAARSVRSAA